MEESDHAASMDVVPTLASVASAAATVKTKINVAVLLKGAAVLLTPDSAVLPMAEVADAMWKAAPRSRETEATASVMVANGQFHPPMSDVRMLEVFLFGIVEPHLSNWETDFEQGLDRVLDR
ncbi:hypothetical protein AC1031_017452 [Aphanomyces cochlioides]|nr:hypothetical protein AC1031_017452 [Aphanomyces cochlioides]